MTPADALGLLQPASTALSGAALVAAGVTLVATREPRAALGVFLDLLLAAGLLRLAADLDWLGIATVAGIVLLRRLISSGLRIGGRNVPPSGRRRGGRPRRPSIPVDRLLRPAWRP